MIDTLKKGIIVKPPRSLEIEIKGAKTIFLKGDKGDVGNDGYTPIKNKDYFDGKDGETPNEKKIIKEVLSKIPTPKDGIDGKNGEQGFSGKDGVDGSSDTGEQIIEKINPLKNVLDFQVLRNIPDFAFSRDIPHSTGGGGGGDIISAGTGITITIDGNGRKRISTNSSGSGITRIITSIAINTTADATSSTDYVYLVSGTTTLTLPTAVGNSNLYTIKNVGNGTVTVAFTSSQTCDGSSTVSLPVQYTAVDLISNGSNWNVT